MSGGKDRSVWIHEANPGGNGDPYVPVACVKNAHKRIIWDITWVGNGSNIIATGARDGVVKVWKISDITVDHEVSSTAAVKSEVVCLGSFSPFSGRAVTALDSTKCWLMQPEDGSDDVGGWCLVVGGECGSLELWIIRPDASTEDTCKKLFEVESLFCHGAAVKRVKWNEYTVTDDKGNLHADSTNQTELKFASGGDDNCVRIFSIMRGNIR